MTPAAKLVIALIAALLIVGGGILLIDARMKPYVATVAQATANSMAVRAVSEAVTGTISARGIEYGDLVMLEKDNAGKISAIKTNIVKINQLRAQLNEAISQGLSGLERATIGVPLGNIVGGDLFAGRGPEIKLRLIPVGEVSSEMENVFTSAGINQTRHQIMLNVKIEMSIMLPVSSVTHEVNTAVCVAETVIVGEVPGAYASLDGIMGK